MDEQSVNGQGWQAEQFEQQRPHLQAVAYRMLGSVTEAEDAVQQTWLRLSRSDNEVTGPPAEQPGGVFCFVADPDGNVTGLHQSEA